VAGGHEHEEEQRRFAREVASWLTQARQNPDAHRVTLFAPARFLGVLRGELVPDAVTELREAELTHLRPSELASHPSVLQAVLGK
jgi:hypothetical protein